MATILVIEDDPLLAALLSRWLSDHELVFGQDANVAALIRERTWDLIIRKPGGEVPTCATLYLSKVPTAGEVEVAAVSVRYLSPPLKKRELQDSVSQLVSNTAKRRRVLAIGENMRSIVLGVGGVLASHHRHAHTVTICCLNKASPQAKLAAKTLGAAEVICEESPSSSFIEELIDKVKPHLLYIPSQSDSSETVRQVHNAAVFDCEKVPFVASYQGETSTVQFSPNRFVSITATIGVKAHAFEMLRRRSTRNDVVRANAVYWARFSDSELVEPLNVLLECPHFGTT